MAQTEMMFKLLKDGKITSLLSISNGDISYTRGGDPKIWDWVVGIQFDSFELGIKVGDEWWFEGNIIEWLHEDFDSYDFETHTCKENIIATGVIKYSKKYHEFQIEQLIGEDNDEAGNSFYNPEGRNLWDWTDFKCIGNIHDNPELLKGNES